MSRDVLLMRHAKSSWSDDALADHDRPLNGRGRRDAPRMAQILLDADLRPARILLSSSERTRETVRRMMEVFGAVDIVVEPDLYLASPETIKGFIETHAQHSQPLMVVAHNPGMEMLVSSVAKALTPMPTAAIAHIRLEKSGPPSMVQLWIPSEQR
jgi:phosphohistidine phosphatase